MGAWSDLALLALAGVEPSLQQSEIERSKRKRPENLDAYDLYLRALPRMMSMLPADARIAEGFLEDALKLDPNYAAAHALIAWCHEICYLLGGREEADKIAGLRHARAAIASGTDDATALAVAAFALGMLSKDYKTAGKVASLKKMFVNMREPRVCERRHRQVRGGLLQHYQ